MRNLAGTNFAAFCTLLQCAAWPCKSKSQTTTPVLEGHYPAFFFFTCFFPQDHSKASVDLTDDLTIRIRCVGGGKHLKHAGS